MKRNPSQKSIRPLSPTNTTYSGISNYKTDSYRPLKDPLPPYSAADPRAIARIHFEELHRYLATYLAKEPANSRSTARQKLTRLTRQQFQELSTDVYDELIRRKTNSSDNEVPFLPVRDDFHPKRNQARQKLATLPTGRFKDLSSDVYYELSRRYPEFREEVSDPASASLTSPGSAYDDYPNPDFPSNAPTSKSSTPAPTYRTRASEDRTNDLSIRKQSEDFGSNRRSEDIYGGMETYSPAPPPVAMMPAPPASGMPSRRKQSQDLYRAEDRRRPSQDTTGRRSTDVVERQYSTRRPSESISTTSDSTSTTTAQSAGMGMIIPNKSTIAEEDIEVPYGREIRDSTGTAVDERERSRRDRSRERETDTDFDVEDDLSPRSPPSALGGLGGLSGLAARLQAADEDDDGGPGGKSDDYFERLSYGRASVASDRSVGGRIGAGRTSVNGIGENERIKRDYEFKIATMQSRITGLERDIEDAHLRSQKSADGDERVRMLEGELEELRRRSEEQANVILSMQKELDQLRNDRSREQETTARRARQDEEELQILRERCERLEVQRGGDQVEPNILDQLRSDMEGLLTELHDLSRRNDELMAAKESDLTTMKELGSQLKDYKRKYEMAKTELRSVKATSQLFLQPPKVDDQLPVSQDGGILDIHVTAFVTAVDSLLTAGRSSSPIKVLAPMKAVINAVASIVEDVRAFERRPRSERHGVTDLEPLKELRDRAEATLSNLVTATKTHATSSGLSPVSLLDAAASHVATTVTELGKIVGLRKASRSEHDQFSPSSVSPPNSSGFSPSLRQIDEARSMHSRNFSSASSKRSEDYRFGSMASPPHSALSRTSVDDRRRPPSHPSSSDGSPTSPPPIFDKSTPTHSVGAHSAGVTSDDSAPAEGTEEAWNELKPYLEAQTEAIVIAIQSVLSAVRSPTPPPSLAESLSQIITIVSSIVAVCKDGVPAASAAEGEEILQDLSDHANRLSEVQAAPEVTKESRQVMAKSSFAVANAMKALMKL